MAPQYSHRQKRPFQPSITSYFSRTDREEYEQSLAYSAPRQPVLDPGVQSDLLSVGMRIRKAVPEGYKINKSRQLFYDSTAAFSNATTTPSAPYQRAELVPFCGLHKIGGHSVQEPHPIDTYANVDMYADTSMPLYSSQESTTSTLSTDSMPAAPMLNPVQANKRRFLDDEEDEDIPPFQLQYPFEVSSPTRTAYPISHTAMPDLDTISSRAIAKPKSKRKAVVLVAGEVTHDVDFEEATFLKWVDGEVEMGGT